MTPADINEVLRKNYIIDRSISLKRRRNFRQFRYTGRSMADALEQYYTNKIRGTYRPDFIDYATNGDNILYDRCQDVMRAGNIHDRLLMIINLSRLEPVFSWARQLPNQEDIWGVDSGEIGGFWMGTAVGVDYGRPDILNEELTRVCQGQPESQDKFIAGVCALLTACHAEKAPYYPTWATRYDDVAAQSRPVSPIMTTPEQLGVCVRKGDWFAGFSFQIRELPFLARPTQLDAGPNAQHYPSPAGWNDSPARGGSAMDISRDCSCARRPLPEYIFTFVALDLRHWLDADRLLWQAPASTANDLVGQRTCHARALVAC